MSATLTWIHTSILCNTLTDLTQTAEWFDTINCSDIKSVLINLPAKTQRSGHYQEQLEPRQLDVGLARITIGTVEPIAQRLAFALPVVEWQVLSI